MCEQKRKNLLLMHIHNCCTRNGEHLVLFIKTGDAHKEIILLPTTVNTFKKYDGGGIETRSKIIVAAKEWFSQLQK